jgi:hypothetical protein
MIRWAIHRSDLLLLHPRAVLALEDEDSARGRWPIRLISWSAYGKEVTVRGDSRPEFLTDSGLVVIHELLSLALGEYSGGVDDPNGA